MMHAGMIYRHKQDHGKTIRVIKAERKLIVADCYDGGVYTHTITASRRYLTERYTTRGAGGAGGA